MAENLTNWTDEQLTDARDYLRGELKKVVDEINARRKRAIKEALRLAALSREDAGARLRQADGGDDGLSFD